jgi:uncharacterized alkaline shock family protein YloU
LLQRSLNKGDLTIFDDVILIITGMALTELDGVKISSKPSKGRLLGKLQKKSKCIKVVPNDEKLTIHLKVAIVYGTNILETIAKLQLLIKKHVELFTGFPVLDVHVIIDQILTEA